MYLKYLLMEPFRWADGFVTGVRQTDKTELIKPVFVLGHWRSGTTHLQTLLAAHPNFACLNMFQAVFSDQFLSTEPWLKPLLQAIAHAINYHNPYHSRLLNWDEAQEEDLALSSMASPNSAYWSRVLGREQKCVK